MPSVSQQQKALVEHVDEAARQYIAGPLKNLLSAEIASLEEKTGLTGHFTLSFGYDNYRRREALDVLVVGYKSVFDTSDGHVEAAVRIEGGARPVPLPAEIRQIVPYAASEMRPGADLTVHNVITVRPERTFWEKVLILHAMTEMTEQSPAAFGSYRPRECNRNSPPIIGECQL